MFEASEEASRKIAVVPGLADTIGGAVPAAKSGIAVLVVDDDRSLREGCVTFFQVGGYDITSTGSGAEAVELVKRRRFDLVMLDLCMTQISGLEILRAILAANKDTLVVIMTGNPTVESNLEALRIGAWD